MAQSKKVTIDRSKIKMAIESSLPLTITTYTLPHDMEIYIQEALDTFLQELNQQHMSRYLNYCLKELINNAKKANTKRIYFADKKLDINDQKDYQAGMKDFKIITMNNIRYYLQKQKSAGLYIKVIMQHKNGKIKLEVRNNCELTFFEYKRIHDKLSRAQQYTNVEQALNQILDNTEGAGLGLVIMILMLQKIGLTEENFQVFTEKGDTVTRMILPVTDIQKGSMEVLSKEFIQVIDSLPQFPENIATINRMLNDPDSKMSDIAMHISNDVSLTGELLKLVNSAAFSLSSPCCSITDAVKLVGIRGIRNLLYSIGSLQNLQEAAKNIDAGMWKHAYKVGFYSYNLVRNFAANDKACVDDAYVCGLLHDMGKIIFESTHPSMVEKLQEICKSKNIPTSLIELLISGVNHGEIGALIAEKWNFPAPIVNVIRYHHDWEAAPENLRKLTSIVYLADMMAHFEEQTVDFYQIDKNILETYKITSESQFKNIADRLERAFSQS